MKQCAEVRLMRKAATKLLMESRPADSVTIEKGIVSCTIAWQRCGARDYFRYKWKRNGIVVNSSALLPADFEG